MRTGKYYLECRDTGYGAYTTMGGERFNISRTGNHWQEVLTVTIGDKIYITDISNTGKHYCRVLKVTEVKRDGSVETEVVQRCAKEYCITLCDTITY